MDVVGSVSTPVLSTLSTVPDAEEDEEHHQLHDLYDPQGKIHAEFIQEILDFSPLEEIPGFEPYACTLTPLFLRGCHLTEY